MAKREDAGTGGKKKDTTIKDIEHATDKPDKKKKDTKKETPNDEYKLSTTYTQEELQSMFNNSTGVSSYNYDSTISSIMSTTTNGIEGLPYQFLESADRRITETVGAGVGRKYADKIFSRLPLLFLTPCEPLFMGDFDTGDQDTIASALLGNVVDNLQGAISETGKYYTVAYNYDEYYAYLNTMLACVSAYLGVYNEEISINGSTKKIGTISWNTELNNSFKTFFSSAENIIFYLDGLNSVSESFSNETTESSLASQINGYADNVNELKFLFGSHGNAAAEIMNSASEISGNIGTMLSGAASALGGGIVESLANGGVHSILNGGKIIFPEIWSNSNFDRSYSIEIKLRSPDHDSLSIFLNILKPYCKLLCLTLPRQLYNDANKETDPNTYGAPFLVKAYSKGLFNIDMGIISSLSVTKGAECCWNDDGLPTQIDITLEVKDLYSHMAMSAISYGGLNVMNVASSFKGIINNTAYIDFLANMAGLNIAQMEMGRRITLLMYLSQTYVNTAAQGIFLRFDNAITNIANKIYNIL